MNLGDALDLLDEDTALKDVMGTEFCKVYDSVKRNEYKEFLQVISPWEREHLLLKRMNLLHANDRAGDYPASYLRGHRGAACALCTAQGPAAGRRVHRGRRLYRPFGRAASGRGRAGCRAAGGAPRGIWRLGAQRRTGGQRASGRIRTGWNARRAKGLRARCGTWPRMPRPLSGT